jgi:superfamily II DNA helicase RecQ
VTDLVDIMTQLHLRDCVVFSQSFNRSNLRYFIGSLLFFISIIACRWHILLDLPGTKRVSYRVYPFSRYEVRPKNKETLKEIVNFVNSQFKSESGIIYCFSKNDCEQTAQKLRVRHGIAISTGTDRFPSCYFYF